MKMLFALLLLLCTLAVSAAPPAVVIILLPGTRLSDWQNADAPALHRLLQTGAVAVMNTRTAHQAGKTESGTLQAALLTLGAGSRAAGTASAAGFVPAAQASDALFERRTGQKPPPGSSICLQWPAAVAANRDPGYDLQLGNLADALVAQGVLIAAGGGPSADWLAVNSRGVVPHAPRLIARPGVCLVWDAGSLPAADLTLADAAAQIAALHGRLVVLSPGVSGQRRALAPVLVWGPGIPAGLLMSPSTRRPGLTTNTDFAPSVAAYFGIPRSEFLAAPFGFAWSTAAVPDAAGQAEAINARAVAQADAMRLLPYLAAALGAWMLVVSVAAVRDFAVPGIICLVPAAALATALFAVSALSFGILALVLLAALLGMTRRVSPAHVLVFGSAALTLALCWDMVTGSRLMHLGLLGYSALEGARYYGIGNEAMGLLLGAALVAADGLWSGERARQIILACALVGITLLLGSAGAKAGGVLVSLAVFGAFLFAAGGRRWTALSLVLLVALAGAGITLAALGDAFLHSGGQSHLGEAVHRIAAGGVGEAWDIARRKLAVEGRLAYHSAWAVLLWLGILCIGGIWRQKPARNSREKALRSAGCVGALACLLLNDAGVVAAAIFVAFLWSGAMAKKSLPALDDSNAGRRIA